MTLLLSLIAASWADPCGMVPPIWTGPGPTPDLIARQGLQQTYVFFRDGVQTVAIRPGFTGSVEEFGMLVPLPAVPALRKIDDRTFEHLPAAVDPPVVQVHIVRPERRRLSALKSAPPPMAVQESAGMVLEDEVRVVKEEAVGMYEVAVLAAGSSSALQRWMDDHRFSYPEGMDATVDDYVDAGWMFVAIKTRVGAMAAVSPAPGQRSVDPGLPEGSSFDGYVQGMAFRFEVDEPVVPMRLAVFNGDDTHNRVYVFADDPVRIGEVSQGFVRRQIPGKQLHHNLTEPLPFVVSGGSLRSDETDQVDAQRSPDPHVEAARDLLLADLMSVATGELSLPFEEAEKELLRINEALGLRGAAIDAAVGDQVAAGRSEAIAPALADVFEVTLTVIDGTFPADVLAEDNLTFAEYRMPASANRFEVWNDRRRGPDVWIYR